MNTARWVTASSISGTGYAASIVTLTEPGIQAPGFIGRHLAIAVRLSIGGIVRVVDVETFGAARELLDGFTHALAQWQRVERLQNGYSVGEQYDKWLGRGTGGAR